MRDRKFRMDLSSCKSIKVKPYIDWKKICFDWLYVFLLFILFVGSMLIYGYQYWRVRAIEHQMLIDTMEGSE